MASAYHAGIRCMSLSQKKDHLKSKYEAVFFLNRTSDTPWTRHLEVVVSTNSHEGSVGFEIDITKASISMLTADTSTG
jgi:hypothetical protein